MIGVYVKTNLCLFGTVMILIANPSADGQSLPPPQNVPSPPTYCKTSALNGPTFMKLIQRIVAHGDLTDIKYIEKTLDIRLPEEEGITPDGTPDPYSPFYRANYVDGSGIHAEIFRYGPNLTSQKGRRN
jgi:hypothetical protein